MEAENEPQLDPELQAKAKAYARLGRRAYFLELGLSALLLAIVLAVNPFRTLDGRVGGYPYGPVAVYFVVLMVGYSLITFPLSVYTGFTLPHRFDMSTQNFRAWLSDSLKGSAIGLVFGLLVVEVIYSLLANVPLYWWLFAAAAMLLFSVVLANLAPVLLVPIFYKLEPLADEELVRRLKALAERAGARVRGVYTMDMSRRTRAANAALMGLGNTRRIVLGDTLVSAYPYDEIEVVLAHELGHHAHNDIVKGIVVETAIGLFSFWIADQALRFGVGALGLRGLADPAGLPLLALVMGAVSLLASPATAWFTRTIETDADRYALTTTGKARAFAAAMTRLANQNLAELYPPRWVEVVFYDHPPIGKRIAMAREYEQRT